ncbi:MAG TPA: cytochrome c3 family protein, partial [Vicinamibacteria bacterium]|nr:cytochrome c3 family protein [Vicinamibacteria bacterium]
KRLFLTVAAIGVLGLGALAATSGYYGGDDGQGCARCHEIRPLVDSWSHSSHRDVRCNDCHGGSFRDQLRMQAKNLQRVWLHARGETPEQIHIRHQDVPALVERCGSCHRQELADWQSGPHGVPYAALFINPQQNANQQLMDDCLRCHAMHFEGGIRDLVAPLDRKGPWTFLREEDAALPAVPCLTCHQVHRPGEPFGPRSRRVTQAGREQEILRPSLALYDRRALEHVGVLRLPLPVMREGERQVRMSPDRRQALCYQCHAPRAGNQVFSGDDRTPVGVHEGLSCQACHAKHGLTTRASCSGCHPRLSNCGLDVEAMDTTFKSSQSRHDIHRVACLDCHPAGVPKKKIAPGATVAAAAAASARVVATQSQ